jgi:hypothetical protein
VLQDPFQLLLRPLAQLTFTYRDNGPARLPKRLGFPRIPCAVGEQLVAPKRNIRLRERRLTKPAGVPETTVHEDRYAPSNEGDIGPSRCLLVVQSVAGISCFAKQLSQGTFRTCIRSTDPAHLRTRALVLRDRRPPIAQVGHGRNYDPINPFCCGAWLLPVVRRELRYRRPPLNKPHRS